VSSKTLKGVYTNGSNHSGRRPLFYKSLGLYQGSINIQLPQDTDESSILPNERVTGLDPIDLNANQDFLIRSCRLKGVEGYQILPINKTTKEPHGHHSSKIIEIALKDKIPIQPKEQLEVELEGFEDLIL
jgi:hypothetical protein